MSLSPTAPRVLPTVFLWLGMALCAAGLVAHRMWDVLPLQRFFEHVLLVLCAFAFAWPLVRWRKWSWAMALALAWLAGLVVFAGLMPVLAVAMLAAAAVAVGSLLLPGPIALPLGLALISGVLGWLLPLQIHYRVVYAAASVALIAWRRDEVIATCSSVLRHFEDAARTSPRAAAAAMLLLGLASTGAWLPTMQYDDVVYHLGLPFQLQETARYLPDPVVQVWALAPWAGDVLQGVAQVLAGDEARGALNALWLAIASGVAFALAGVLGGDATPANVTRRWWSVAMLASLPLSMALAGGMQTELPAMALLPALALLVLRRPADAGMATVDRRAMLAGAALFGALCGLKAMHAAVALPVLIWAGWRHRHGIPWRWLPVTLLVAALVGGSNYTNAWLTTGNPVLPLMNSWFRSPFFASRDFIDARWQGGLDADVLWDLSFDTEQYFEEVDGSFGFVLIALLGVWLLALRDVRTRGLAAVASIALLLPLLPMQYARYLQPSLALLLPALVVAYPVVKRGSAAFWALCVLNLAFATNASWVLRAGGLKHVVRHPGQDTPALQRYLPERELAKQLRAPANRAGTVLVLPGSDLALAELGARGRNMLWYSPRWKAEAVRVEADGSGEAWASLLHDNKIRHVILRPARLTPPQRAGLALSGAQLVQTTGSAQWWRIPDNATP
ncbi:MAG: hypothetical protein ACOH1L_05035 [Thermomonas sp.]